MIKRESGERPEQTRCCKFHIKLEDKQATVFLTKSRHNGFGRKMGRHPHNGTSQKTCHLSFFLTLSGNKAVEYGRTKTLSATIVINILSIYCTGYKL